MNLTANAVFRPRSSSGQFVAAKVTPSVVASVQALVDIIVQEAKTLCPVDTGELQASIAGEVKQTDKTVVGTIGTDVYYAAYNEFGTGIRGAESPGAGPYEYNMGWPGMPATPYLRPALDLGRQIAKDLMQSQIAIGLQL